MFGALDNRTRVNWPSWMRDAPENQEPRYIVRNGVHWWWNGTVWVPLDKDPYFSSVAYVIPGGFFDTIGPKNYGAAGNSCTSSLSLANTTKFHTYAFAGTGATNVDDVMLLASSAAQNAGSGDFTFEIWVYPTLAAAGILLDARPSTSTNGAYHAVYIGGTYDVRYYVNTADRITGGSNSVTSSAWNHVAVARTGTSTKLFVNGAQVGSTWSDSTTYLQTQHQIGNTNGTVYSRLNGFLELPRYTKGVCRYTANFTAPDKPFPLY